MVTNGNVTGLVERLASEGMVERAPAPDDRRIQMVSLTSRGKENFANMAENHIVWILAMMEQLTANELNSLYDLLARLKESILTAEQKNNLEAAE